MISSLPIDEQRDFRRSTLDPPSSASNPTPTPAPEPKPYVYDSDDDRDPNDIVAQPVQNAGKTDDPYAFDESDSESDWTVCIILGSHISCLLYCFFAARTLIVDFEDNVVCYQLINIVQYQPIKVNPVT